MGYKQPQAQGQQAEDFFGLIENFGSYISKPEVTNVAPNYLVKGSKNVFVDFANRVISRPGYRLYNQANTGSAGIQGSYEWETSTGSEFSIRTYAAMFEFDWNGTYNTLLSNLSSPLVEFAKVLDYTEQQDVLLFVYGTGSIGRWSGGVSKVRDCPTATTLRKQGVITAATTIAFTAGDGLMVAPTITDSAANFLNAGFATGDTVNVTGSTANSREYTVGSVTAGAITLIMTNVLTAEAAGATITIYNQTGPTWKAARFFSSAVGRAFWHSGVKYLYGGGETTDTLTGVVLAAGTNVGTATISHATPAVVTHVAHGLVVGDALYFTTTGALPAGLTVNTPYFVIAAGFGVDAFELSALPAGAAINTTDNGSGTHTLFKATPTLSVAVGDPVWQAADSFALPSAITTPFPNFFPDLIGVQLNMVFIGSTQSSMVFASENSDYTNFTLTSPRAAGDPVQQPLTSGPATCIVPVDTDSDVLNVINTLIFGSGRDAFDQIDFHMSQDNTEELLRIIRYKTAVGSGLISKGAICPIKNDTVYISREPALDSLSRSELEAPDGSRNTPISDPIKNDFDAYDFTGAHVKYWKRAIFIALPAAGVVLVYDMMRNLWHPPQTMPIARLGIVQDQLIGHSSVTNETYQLFVGTNDNGNFIPFVARFAYNNGGRRDRIKNMSSEWSDGYISPNGLLNLTIGLGFEASAGKKTFPISGSDSSIVTGKQATPLGNAPFGFNPLGGTDIASPSGNGAGLYRFFQIDTMDLIDYIEHYVEYSMNTLDGQFAIVAHGSDQWDAGTSAVTHKK